MELALRQRLRRVVLDSDTQAGRIYNLVIFGTILLSVAGLLVEPHPLRVAAPGEIPAWVGELERVCLLVFMADYLLHLWVSPRPLAYARSFFGLIDLSAVLFFFVPQINSGLSLGVQVWPRVAGVQAAALHGRSADPRSCPARQCQAHRCFFVFRGADPGGVGLSDGGD